MMAPSIVSTASTVSATPIEQAADLPSVPLRRSRRVMNETFSKEEFEAIRAIVEVRSNPNLDCDETLTCTTAPEED